MHRLPLITVLTILALAASAAAQSSIVVKTASGEAVPGPLRSFDGDMLSVGTADDVRQIKSSELQRIDFNNKTNEATPFAKVFLNDGSRIHCSALTISGGVANCQLASEAITIPTDAIQYIRISPFRAAVDDEWQDILKDERASDQIVVRRKNHDIVYLDGVFGDVTSDHVEFEFDDEVMEVKFAKIDGMIFFHSSRAKFPRPACIARTIDGSELAVDSIAITDSVQLTLLSSLQIQLPMTEISSVAFNNRSAVFLSDLVPEKSVWQSAVASSASDELTRFFKPRRDKGFHGQRLSLTLDGKPREFAKGIAALSHTELTYRLAGEYRSFKATVGIDPRIAPRGEARLEIWADSKKLIDRFIRGADSPVEVDVSLAGVSRMRIVVDKGKILGDGDYVSLCDARLLK